MYALISLSSSSSCSPRESFFRHESTVTNHSVSSLTGTQTAEQQIPSARVRAELSERGNPHTHAHTYTHTSMRKTRAFACIFALHDLWYLQQMQTRLKAYWLIDIRKQKLEPEATESESLYMVTERQWVEAGPFLANLSPSPPVGMYPLCPGQIPTTGPCTPHGLLIIPIHLIDYDSLSSPPVAGVWWAHWHRCP